LGQLDEADEWNSSIVDKLQPVESDIVLKKRTHISAWEGSSEFRTTFEENEGIQAVILLGFLSDGAIEETAIDLMDALPDLNVIVCHDGTASMEKKHSYTMNKVRRIGIQCYNLSHSHITTHRRLSLSLATI